MSLAAENPAPGVASTTTSHPYTCSSCQVAFKNGTLQREHMRSDWQYVSDSLFSVIPDVRYANEWFNSRYNLKRRLASLPAASAEAFNKLVLTKQAAQQEEERKAAFEKTCRFCQKVYHSENAFNKHLTTARHRANEAEHNRQTADESASVASGAPSTSAVSLGGESVQTVTATASEEISKVTEQLQQTTVKDPATDQQKAESQETAQDSTEQATTIPAPAETDYPLTHCLFCNVEEESLAANADHMYKQHGMFVPERPYLANPTGLLKYLYAKITQNFECLYCHRLKSSAEAIRTHMLDKGHCMIAYSSEDEMLEIGQFYDFRSTYTDGKIDDDDDDEAMEVVEGGGGDDEGWETDDSSDDEDEPPGDIYENDRDLHLPSGRVAGHRSMAKYFRQNLRNYAVIPEERVSRQKLLQDSAAEKTENKRASGAMINRMNGGLVGASDFQKKEAQTTAKREQKRIQRIQNEYNWHVNKNANNQKHYRVCIICCDISLDRLLTHFHFRINFCSDLALRFSGVSLPPDKRNLLDYFAVHWCWSAGPVAVLYSLCCIP